MLCLERVIIISDLFSKVIKSLNLRTLSEVSLSERSDGSGTIIFGSGSFWDNASWLGRRQESPRFELSQDARKVYETIRDAQRRAE